MALTDKQARFIEEYLVDLNATQAAIRAGYSEKTANEQGSRLLANVKVSDAIAEAQKERSERTQITQDRVLLELARLSFSDLRKCLTPSGHLVDPQDWDDDTAAAISSLEVVTNRTSEKDADGKTPVEYTHKIKTWDKNAALEKLSKHLGLYAPEKKEISGPDGGPLEVVETPASVRLNAMLDKLSSVSGDAESG
ncbi:terminase small subunit [uncultured Roseibium sp.]|uniref:terminase small subunit n=1 Tax=uncultured Roseibium sp. TaxID=1936171 RepID=UPI00261FDFBD|nr:terminase small subunit [uncultured Roseibium sp.]